MFLIRFPDGFVPEEHGWQPSPNAQPGARIWERWHIPFRFPAVLGEAMRDPETGAVGGWYSDPAQGPERTATLRELWDEIRTGPPNE
ncbi:hypothetical protein [Streptomyces sp. cg36]|uniref:hypothetical protein n=1 Tax=Streptomyces sp. cg36 TaxID=3238798 RepID=UPI0034E201B1